MWKFSSSKDHCKESEKVWKEWKESEKEKESEKLRSEKTFAIGIYPVGACPVAQRVKRLPAMRETQVRSLGPEDPLEKDMATHSSVLAWKIPWKRRLAGYSP